MKFWPPKEINMWYGYRTSLSTSSDQAWRLAQSHNAKMMLLYGLVMIMLGLIIKMFFSNSDMEDTLILIEVTIILPLLIMLMMYSTHQYVKKNLKK